MTKSVSISKRGSRSKLWIQYLADQGTHYGIIVQYELKPMSIWFADPEPHQILH